MHWSLWNLFLFQLAIFLGVLFITIFIYLPIRILLYKKSLKQKRTLKAAQNVSVGFFHPYCNTGGGGERVLWCAVKAIRMRYPTSEVVVYTGDLDASPEEILNRVLQRFNMKLDTDDVKFVYLRRRWLVEGNIYPTFTLLGQSVGSFLLGLEAFMAHVPDVYIDTMGYAFTYPLFRYVGDCRVGCYTHYPTITSDMLHRVMSRTVSYNNKSTIARSPFLTAGKLIYYRLFAMVYGWAGRAAEIVMVNSSWTEGHINELWQCPLRTHRVYPPCDVDDLKSIPIDGDRDAGLPLPSPGTSNNTEDSPTEGNSRKFVKIVSVAQYRPEKDHPLQLRSMYQLRHILPDHIWESLRLVFVGSCRNAEDEERVQDMKDLCKHLSLEENVDFRVNVPYEELRRELEEGTIGLHAMWNEHFGIGVVECMSAGLIMVAHRSGGPQMDIIEEAEGSRNGFLASDEQEYAAAIAAVLWMSPESRKAVREAARSSVERFSVQEFNKGFLRAVEPLFSQQ